MVAVIRRCGGPEISGGNGDCNEPMMAGKLGLPVPSTSHPDAPRNGPQRRSPELSRSAKAPVNIMSRIRHIMSWLRNSQLN